VVRVAGHHDPQVLEDERDAAKGAVGQGRSSLTAGGLEPLVDHGVDLRVDLLDAFDGSVHEL
jgi:hypothetical protein